MHRFSVHQRSAKFKVRTDDTCDRRCGCVCVSAHQAPQAVRGRTYYICQILQLIFHGLLDDAFGRQTFYLVLNTPVDALNALQPAVCV